MVFVFLFFMLIGVYGIFVGVVFFIGVGILGLLKFWLFEYSGGWY